MTPLTDLDERRTRSFEISLSERNYSERFDEQLETLSKQGFRILAMAMKKLESEFYQTLQNVIDGAMELPRDKIESNLQFIGVHNIQK